MTTLHLGVIELPYTEPNPKPKRMAKARPGKQKPRKQRKAAPENQTTYDVAVILEGKYHVMETYFDLHEQEIGDAFAESMAGALESLVMGAPPARNPLASAEAAVEAGFKHFLETKEMDDTSTPGVPTKASLRGVNHRLKRKRGPSRPSFIDTGLYESSFKAWTTP